MIYPGYSGLANVRDSNGSFIITTDCNLSLIDAIQLSITNVNDPLNGANPTPRSALYFVYADSNGTVQDRFWTLPTTSLFGITRFNVPTDGVITLNPQPPEIGERYYLTYTAYGIRLTPNGTLQLFWNFRPWNGETVFTGQALTLMENATSFEYWNESQGTMLRFRVCLGGERSDAVVCKEGVVLR
jgi:hypothetical protein